MTGIAEHFIASTSLTHPHITSTSHCLNLSAEWTMANTYIYIYRYYTYIHTYTCMHACIHTYTDRHTYMHACMHAYIHTYTHTYGCFLSHGGTPQSSSHGPGCWMVWDSSAVLGIHWGSTKEPLHSKIPTNMYMFNYVYTVHWIVGSGSV